MIVIHDSMVLDNDRRDLLADLYMYAKLWTS